MHNHMHIPGSAALKEVVQLFWEVSRADENPMQEIIVPKGTVEIIFNLCENAELNADINERRWAIPRCFISGFHTTSIRMDIPGTQHFFGINLQGLTAYKIFGLTARDFSNKCLDLADTDHSFRDIWCRMMEASSFEERTAIASAWLLRRIPELSARESLLNEFLNNADAGSYSVNEISKALCYSNRQLSRKLYALTGMNAEQTLLYKKYLQSVRLMHGSNDSLTGIAYACGFTDQSHFIRTFRAFAGMRPGDYRQIKSHVEGHIFQPAAVLVNVR